jgi:very-short-patch-repair endonuclease
MLNYNNKLTPRARQMRRNMTNEERILWYDFLKSHPMRFCRQKVIDNYIVDFYCHRAKLIIELDGLHHKEVNRKEYDDIRTDYFKSMGILTLRFTNAQIKTHFNYVCKKIDEAISSRKA